MLKIAIIIGVEDNFPIWFKYDGLAKSKKDAIWVFEFCGWKSHGLYPQLTFCEETIEWQEGEKYISSNNSELFILGAKLILN